MDFTRRQLLGAVLISPFVPTGCIATYTRPVVRLLANLSGIPSILEPPPRAVTARTASIRRVIDAHAHFFDASDVPVRGFIAECLSHRAPFIARRLLSALAPLADRIASRAPTAAEEIAFLHSLIQRTEGTALAAAQASAQVSLQQERQTTAQRVADVIRGSEFERIYQELKSGGAVPVSSQRETSPDQILATVSESEFPGPEAAPVAAQVRSDNARIADGILGFLYYMLAYRSTNVDAYVAAYRRNARAFGIDMVLGSLVDFDRWLERPPRAAHDDQIAPCLACTVAWRVPQTRGLCSRERKNGRTTRRNCTSRFRRSRPKRLWRRFSAAMPRVVSRSLGWRAVQADRGEAAGNEGGVRLRDEQRCEGASMKTFVAFSVLALLAMTACEQTPPAANTTAAPPAAAPVAAPAQQEPKVAPQESPTGDIEFKSALDLKQLPGAQPELRHGKVAISKDWPASLYATFKTAAGKLSACTAALVGPRAILTAAHCVPPSGKVSFVYAGHGSAYVMTCTKHSAYPSDASADYALCKIDGDRVFAEPVDFHYETINTSSMDTVTGKTIVLTGFGCISDIVADPAGKPDGKYRIGTNDVVETSNATSPKLGSASGLYAGKQNNNLFTKDDPALANLCPGDSGGPAFRETGASVGQFTSRVIVGVNSRVFYANLQQTAYGASLISATGGPDFRTWAENWAKNTAKVQMCGIEGSIPNCRS